MIGPILVFVKMRSGFPGLLLFVVEIVSDKVILDHKYHIWSIFKIFIFFLFLAIFSKNWP